MLHDFPADVQIPNFYTGFKKGKIVHVILIQFKSRREGEWYSELYSTSPQKYLVFVNVN